MCINIVLPDSQDVNPLLYQISINPGENFFGISFLVWYMFCLYP